jgi:hypothetical protein
MSKVTTVISKITTLIPIVTLGARPSFTRQLLRITATKSGFTVITAPRLHHRGAVVLQPF